jgi:hypothetical protein
MTVYARGIDYAWQHPDPKAIKDAGFDFVCRYYSRDPSKNLTRAEADALTAAGLWIVGNWEYGAQDALRGYAGGVSDATLARQQADACGQPHDRPTYFSKDWDVTPAQEATVTEYDRGADSVLGVGDVGDYGGFYPLRVQRDAGVISWEWQTTAWSGGLWEPRVNIRQVGTATIGGVQVDVNEAYSADFGQWQPGRSPSTSAPTAAPAPPEGLPMEFIAAVAPDPAHPDNNPGAWVWSADGSYIGIAGPTDLQELESLQIKQISISFEMHQRLLAASARTSVQVDAAALGAAIAAGIKLPTGFTGTLT